MNITQLSGTSFVLYGDIRQTIHTNAGCAWCGQNHHGRLFNYGTHLGIGQTYWGTKNFCSISCRRAYFDEVTEAYR